MIRYAKHNGTNYIIVDTTMKVNGIGTPVQVQINVQNVTEESRSRFFKVASVAFDRLLDFDKPKTDTSKSWWQRIFKG